MIFPLILETSQSSGRAIEQCEKKPFVIPLRRWLAEIPTLSGWWYTYPYETYESQLGSLFPIYMEK
jgi:hypothetical protein